MINWIPLTQDEARGVLTSLEIAYKPVRESDCFNNDSMDSEIVLVRENLFEQNTANITGLEPNREYCVAIQVSTSGGESGFSNSLKLPCKLCPYISMCIYMHRTYIYHFACSAQWSSIPN